MKIDREIRMFGFHAGGKGQVTCSEARRRNWRAVPSATVTKPIAPRIKATGSLG